jgi:endoribonuclease Dicer
MVSLHSARPKIGRDELMSSWVPPAILDYWSTMRLYPLAVSTTPRFLTFRRAMLVSNSTLALIAIRKLRLHKSILHNSPRLDNAIREAAELADKVEWRDVIEGDLTWVWSLPKVRNSVFSSIARNRSL